MEKQPLVTVIMPSYNHCQYIREAIDSVLRQTYANFEFLIVDDGSTDGSSEIIKEYDDARIVFFEYARNTVFGAWEEMNRLAKGKYVSYLASDDIWHEDKLEKQVSFLEENEEYKACFTWVEMIDEKSQPLGERHVMNELFNTQQENTAAWYKRLFMGGNSLVAQSYMMLTDIFQELGGFHFKYRQLQDYELWLRFMLKHKLYVIPEKLIYYRWHEGDSTANMSARTNATIIRNWNEMLHIYSRQIEWIDDEFFVRAFKKNLLIKNPQTHAEVMCEKFFLMLNHPRVEAQQCGINYYLTHIDEQEFKDCIEGRYGFSRGDFYTMEVNRGLMKAMRDLEDAVEESKKLAYKAIAKVREFRGE